MSLRFCVPTTQLTRMTALVEAEEGLLPLRIGTLSIMEVS